MEAAQRLRLWEISDAHEALAEKLMDAGGEITPELAAEWENLTGDFDEKVEGSALYIRELMANAAAAKEEADRLNDIHTALANRALRMKAYLQFHMERTGRTKVQTPRAKVWVQANGGRPAIHWTKTLVELPTDFTITEVKPDFERAHQALKSGEQLPYGFYVEPRGSHIRIL